MASAASACARAAIRLCFRLVPAPNRQDRGPGRRHGEHGHDDRDQPVPPAPLERRLLAEELLRIGVCQSREEPRHPGFSGTEPPAGELDPGLLRPEQPPQRCRQVIRLGEVALALVPGQVSLRSARTRWMRSAEPTESEPVVDLL